MRRARDDLQFVNVTGLDLIQKTPDAVYGHLRMVPPRTGVTEGWAHDVVIPKDAQMRMYTSILKEFAAKREECQSYTRRAVYRPFTFVDHQKCIAVVFLHASISQLRTIPEIIESAKRLNFDLGMSGVLGRVMAWRSALEHVDALDLLQSIETALQQHVVPSTITVIDESLPQSTHQEVNPSTRCIIKMARKPSGLGRLLYQAVCEWDWSGLPFSFGMELFTHVDRVTSGEAFIRLVRKRFLNAPNIHASFLGDAAFSARDVRKVVVENALLTDGHAVDVTLSVNYNWDKPLWDALSHNLKADEYRVFYSPLTEATVVLFKVNTRGEDHLIIRWSNAYEDPRGLPSIPAPERYSWNASSSLLKWPIVDLQTLCADMDSTSTSNCAYELVKIATGNDHVERELLVGVTEKTHAKETMLLPNGETVSVDWLLTQDRNWLDALCKAHHLCATSGKMTKPELVKQMQWGCRISSKTAKEEVNLFTSPTLSFEHPTKTKEEVLPDPVPTYKASFNLQDVFDHYLSSIDPVTRLKEKDARMTEIAYMVGLVNVWTLCAEQSLKKIYATRGQYVTALAKNKKAHPSESYNIRCEFLPKLRDHFLNQ